MPYSCTVESELAEQWSDVVDALGTGIRHSVEHACKEGAEEARRVRTFKDRTGDLYRSIRGELDTATRMGAEGHIEAREPYASFVEGGTRPHEIVARRALALRWEDSDGVHFATRVHHPGTRPMPYMGPGYHKAERVLEADLELVAANVQKELR